MEDQESPDRLKFFGQGDLGNFMFADQAVAMIRTQTKKSGLTSLNDALEVYNALQFEKHGILPTTLSQDERDALPSNAALVRRQLAAFFAAIDSSNIREHLSNYERDYTQDLLYLTGMFSVAKNVGGQELVDALLDVRVPLWAMLGDRKFVKEHDRRLRDVLMSDARHGELLVSSRILKNSSDSYMLPTSLTRQDSQKLFKDYIESKSPHLNYVEAIANAQDDEKIGITTKIRLAAQRRLSELTSALFTDETNVITSTGYAMGVDPDQKEPVVRSVERIGDKTLYRHTFGGMYLKASMDPAHILANFSYLIGYLEERGLLALPSFRAQIGVFESLLVSGKNTYPRGGAFNHRDSLTILGTEAYYDFLRQECTEVEDVLDWYFRDYVPEVFDAVGFSFAPSTITSTYLERCRHLCAEMESIAKQFTLYCEDGEIDRELLEMTSAPRPWGQIPSLIDRKYLVRSMSKDCEAALTLLFNDQSRINYINDELQARSFVELVLKNQVSYADLHHGQTSAVDWLAEEGIVSLDEGIIGFSSLPLLRVLKDVYAFEAGPSGHYEIEAAAAEKLVAKGWLEFRSTLLSPAESSYFNFFLNSSEFSDGPDLRNNYHHGSNRDPQDEAAHRTAYLQLLRLAVALVLKIQDDFAVHAQIIASSAPASV